MCDYESRAGSIALSRRPRCARSTSVRRGRRDRVGHGRDERPRGGVLPADDGLIVPTNVVVAAYRTREPYLVVPVNGLRLRFPAAQILPDGILLVGTRCSRRTGTPELNAEVRDLNGKRLRRGCIGDGITFVRATPSGDVWAGYFDEGIFGNLGWGDVGGRPSGQRRCRALVQPGLHQALGTRA
ncbi:hypothetical protein NKG05_12940 [Oerskovia sp. M15]